MNVLIVEDEIHTANLLQDIIEQNGDFIVLAKLQSIAEAVQYLSKYQKNLDLLFFDIQLADGLSFEIFKHVDVSTPIIFCTAYDEYSLQAIKNNGIDYVLKPFNEVEIHKSLEKFKKLISSLTAKQSPIQFKAAEQDTYQQNFLTQFREKTIVFKASEIALFSVENETVSLYTFKGEKYPIYKNMEYIESVCDPNLFYRISRQMLVSRESIQSFEPYFNRKVALELKVKTAEIPVVSRLKVTAFKDWLEK